MPQPKIDHTLERWLAELLRTQERLAKADDGLERAREARDDAIRNASAAGLTRRSVAQATGLTPGRIQQIIDQKTEGNR